MVTKYANDVDVSVETNRDIAIFFFFFHIKIVLIFNHALLLISDISQLIFLTTTSSNKIISSFELIISLTFNILPALLRQALCLKDTKK